MDRRTLLAIGLMLIVAILPAILFSPRRPSRDATGPRAEDSVARVTDTVRAGDTVTARLEEEPPEPVERLRDTSPSSHRCIASHFRLAARGSSKPP
jgi:hypothetical protein